MSTVFFISEASTTTRLFLPVAKAIARLAPGVECRLLDVSKIAGAGNEVIESENRLFTANGFAVEELALPGGRRTEDWRWPYLKGVAEIFQRDRAAILVVPHEYDWAYDAVQVAKFYGVPSYHLMHGLWAPMELGGDQPLIAARRIGQVDPAAPRPQSALERQKEIMRAELRLLRDVARGRVHAWQNVASTSTASADTAKRAFWNFPRWQVGDVVAIDNFSVAHGRMPYRGARQVAVCWA